MKRLLFAGLMLLAAAIGLQFVPAGSGTATAATVTVNLADNVFQPATMTINAGDTVHWNWTGSNPHSVTADDGSFDSGTQTMPFTFDQTFSSAGTFPYHCNVHGAAGGVGMSGTITVQQAAASTPTAGVAAPTSTRAAGTTPVAAATSTRAAGGSPVASLPSTGAGADNDDRGYAFHWLSIPLAVLGALALTGAFVTSRKRA